MFSVVGMNWSYNLVLTPNIKEAMVQAYLASNQPQSCDMISKQTMNVHLSSPARDLWFPGTKQCLDFQLKVAQ